MDTPNNENKPKLRLTNEIRIDQKKIEKLLQAVIVGAPISTALAFAEISERTYYYWLEITNQINKILDLDILDNISNVNDISVDIITMCEREEIDIELVRRLKNTPAYAKDPCDVIARVKQAQASCEVYHLNKIRNADRTTGWQSSAWWLERRRNAEYGKKEFDNNTDKQVKVESIKVQYVDPKIDQDRVKEMEELVKSEIEGVKK